LNLLKALSTVSGMTLLSRVTGLVRESIKATAFGAGFQMDAFEAAFRLPNLLRRLFAEGAFSQAFVPILAEYHRQQGAKASRVLVGKVGTLLAVVLLAVTAIGVLAAPWLVYLLAGGFAKTPGKVELTAEMIRIVFPYILFVSLVSLAGGVLNVYRRFAIPAFTPVLLNVAIIGAALFLAPHVDPPIMALAWGVLIGGFPGPRSISRMPACAACCSRWDRRSSASRPRRSRRSSTRSSRRCSATARSRGSRTPTV
jgi:putative peptidoglycan lipid II flippase